MAGTCYLPNGQIAEGVGKAACDAGGGRFVSTEKATQQAQLNSQPTPSNPFGKIATGLGTAAGLAIGFTPVGRAFKAANAGRKLFMGGKPMEGRVGNLMDKFFRRDKFTPAPPVNPTAGLPKYPLLNKSQQASALKKMNQNLPMAMTKSRGLNPYTIGGTGAGVVGAGSAFMGRGGGAEQRAITEQNSMNAMMSNMQNLQGQQDAALAKEAASKAEADRVAGLNPMQRMMENLKNPEFLNESMSGQPGDTRLNRLGQLMSYYGGTPKQRAAMGDPQKRFAEIESNVATNKAALAKAQATLQGKSPFGSLGTTGLAKGLESLVKERYPSTFGFGGIDEKDVEGVAARVASVMQQLAQENPLTASQPGGIEQIREAAFSQVEQELGL